METFRIGSNRWLPYPVQGFKDESLLIRSILKKPILVDGEPPSRGLRLMFNSYVSLSDCEI
jgi:hypothetical protein